MSKALVRVRTTRHPISEEVIGFRLEAAIPNSDGRIMKVRHDANGKADSFYATKEEAPSFRKPFFIEESSDYSLIDERKLERFVSNLKWQGYDEFELVGKYQGEPLAAQFVV
ncbi:MAG: hypothetical protein FWF12_00250 [Betaproteobacteria bacterium]|nr:hypothetical protein [Betaproteobacteria bacterium]